MLLAHILPPGDEPQQGLNGLFRQHSVLRLPGDDKLLLPVYHGHMKFIFQNANVFVKGAEKADSLLHALQADALFHALPP